MGSITKQEKVDRNGKKVVVYRAFVRRKVNGKSVGSSKVCKSRQEAKDWIAENENQDALKALSSGSGPLFSEVVETFVKAPPVRGTKYWHPSHLDFWNERFKGRKINSITRADINAGVGALQVRNVVRGSFDGKRTTDKVITPATVNRYLASLSSILNYALNLEIIDAHPIKGGKVKKLKESGGRRRILNADEEQRIYAAADQSRWPMMRLFLRMCLTTGARKSEVLKLKWESVHLDESIAVISKTKNDEARALPLVSDVKAALAAAQKIKPISSDYVFFDPKHPSKPMNIGESWKQVRIRAGLYQDREDPLDQVVLHSTRHTVATKLLKKGANIAQTANITGHKTLSMLKRYTHLAAQDAVDVAQKLLAEDDDKQSNTVA